MSEATTHSPPRPNRLQLLFWELFELDVRSLAVFRVALGLVILFDLFNRFAQIELLYSDAGILTREMSQEYLGEGFWSLFWIDGSLFYAQVLFALTAVAAIALVLGMKTTLATIACLVLVSSLQFRNPLVLTGGHVLLRVMLFWSMFLPLGAVWSLDAKWGPYKDPEKWRVASLATMAMMIQVACLYFFSGIAKLNGLWFGGEAVEYVMSLEMYVKPFGDAIRQLPWLLKGATYLTLVAELSVPLLLFIPKFNQYTRGMAMALFLTMHLAIWASMSIGIFSLMAMISWIIFIPNNTWNTYVGNHDESLYDYAINLTLSRILAQAACGIALVLMLAMHIASVNPDSNWFPESMQRFSNRILITQRFRLFGDPLQKSPSFEYRANMADLSSADIFKEMMHEPGTTARTEYEYFSTQYWRRIHSNLMDESEDGPTPAQVRMRERLLDRIVHLWNTTHTPEREVVDAELFLLERPIRLNNSWGKLNATSWAVWKKE